MFLLTGVISLGSVFEARAGAPIAAPVITSFTPASGATGTAVVISGSNFNPVPANDIVYFGAVRATVVTATSTHLSVTVPAGAIFAPITVTVNGLTAWSKTPFLPTFPGAAATIDSSSFAPRLDLPDLSGSGFIAFADLDGDGKPDLITTSGYGPVVSIYRNISTNGTLTADSFAARVDITAGTYTSGIYSTTTVGDLDGDGRLDIIVITDWGQSNSTISVLQNFCTPGTITSNSFGSPVKLLVAAGVRGVAAQDIDGDGKADIVTGNFDSSTISVLRNIGTGGVITSNSFAPAVNYSTGTGTPQAVTIADLDGDGQPDIVTVNFNDSSGNNAVSIFRNVSTPGTIALAPRVDLPGPLQSGSIAIGDMDGDGKADIVTCSFNFGQVASVYRNLSTPGSISFATDVDFSLGGWGNAVTIGDLDGDGKLDVAVAVQLPSQISIFKNTSTPGSFTASSLAPRVDLASGYNPYGVTIGDLDGDGRPELIFDNDYDSFMSIYQNVIPATASVCDPAPSGLVAWWPGEGNANDIIGGNNGTVIGGTTFANGEVGQAFSVNGNAQYVEVPQSPVLNPSDQITIEFWMKADPSNPMTTYQGLVTSDFFGIEIAPSLLFYSSTDNGSSWVITPGATVSSGVWHHVAATYDGAQMCLYIDGQIWSTIPQSGNISHMLANSFLAFGSEDGRTVCNCSGNRYFNGLIDEVSIYNRALSANEIATIYDAQSEGKCQTTCDPAPSGLVSWWPGEGNPNDIIGGDNGTVVGTIGYASGKVGQAFSLNGASGYVAIPDSPSMDSFTNSITVECWIKGNLLGANPIWTWIVTKGNASWRLMATEGDDTVTFWASGVNTPGNDGVYGTRNVNDGQWHHIAGVYDGANIFLYVDGTLDTSRPATGSIFVTGSSVEIGYNSDAPGGNIFNGLIDEVSLYHRALSASEIQAIYLAGSAGKCPAAPVPPVADATATGPLLISPNGINASAVLDGSKSYDADGDPLQYTWLDVSNNVIGTGVAAAVTLPVGNNSITLTVSDGVLSNSQTITVTVLTISQAIDQLIGTVNQDVAKKQPLTVLLRAARMSVGKGNPLSAINQLRTFQTKVNVQIGPVDPVLAQTLSNDVQAIIDAITSGGAHLKLHGQALHH
jgi:hypothetical protein